MVRLTGLEPAAFRVGVPRHTTPNRDFKPFSSVVHKVEKHIKRPRSIFRTGFAGVCMRVGQIVVTLKYAAIKLNRWQYTLTYI